MSIGSILNLNPCGQTTGIAFICTPRPGGGFPGLNLSPAQERPAQPAGPSPFLGTEFLPGIKRTIYVPFTVAISFIYARNGHRFLAVSAGPATGDTSEPGTSVSESLRWGYFDSRTPLSSHEIDQELVGRFVAVGATVGPAGGSVVKSFGGGGRAFEIAIAETGEPGGAEVQVGQGWRIG